MPCAASASRRTRAPSTSFLRSSSGCPAIRVKLSSGWTSTTSAPAPDRTHASTCSTFSRRAYAWALTLVPPVAATLAARACSYVPASSARRVGVEKTEEDFPTSSRRASASARRPLVSGRPIGMSTATTATSWDSRTSASRSVIVGAVRTQGRRSGSSTTPTQPDGQASTPRTGAGGTRTGAPGAEAATGRAASDPAGATNRASRSPLSAASIRSVITCVIGGRPSSGHQRTSVDSSSATCGSPSTHVQAKVRSR